MNKTLFFFVAASLTLCANAFASEENRRAFYLDGVKPTSTKRIVSLGPNLTEIAFALGAAEQMVGRTKFCAHPEQAKGLPSVGGLLDVQLEKVLELKPDFVLATASNVQRSFLKKLRAQNIAVLVAYSDNTIEIADAISTISKVLNQHSEGLLLLKAQARHLDAFKKYRETSGDKKRALVVVSTRPLVVAGPRSFPDEALGFLGLRNAAPQKSPLWPTLPLESVVGAPPDYIILSGGKSALEGYQKDLAPIFKGKKAPKVLYAAEALLQRPGPHWFSDIEKLKALIDEAQK